MQILILGGGTVGYTIAKTLSNGSHNITVIEKDRQRAEQLNDLEVRVVVGSASWTSILFKAGVETCDICLAVTGSEETNILAASIAKAMGAKKTIARVYSSVYTDLSDVDYEEYFHIDRLISLEKLTALEIVKIITHSQVLYLVSHGELEAQEIEIQENSPVIGKTLLELQLSKKVRVIVALLKREQKTRLMLATDAFQQGDIVSLVGKAEDIEVVVKQYFKVKLPRKQRVTIMGGGETGYNLAQTLQKSHFEITILEKKASRSDFLASHLDSSVSVVKANGLERHDLEENSVGSMDLFIACTGDDEENIMGAVEAKELGAKHVFSIVSRPEYATVMNKLDIDQVVSPRSVITQRIRGLLNTDRVVTMRMLIPGQSNIEVIQIKVVPGTPVCQDTIRNIGLPKECLIVGVIRKHYIQVPDANFQIEPGDTVILLVHNRVYEEMLAKFSV